jgi:hypothetical protein
MPKYRVTLEQHKEKVIRASSLDIAEERGKKMAKGLWILTEVKEVKE